MFKLGDTVRVKSDYDFPTNFNNLVGKIVIMDTNNSRIGVEFINIDFGHNLAGCLQTDSGRWFDKDEITLVNPHICGLVCKKCNPRDVILF